LTMPPRGAFRYPTAVANERAALGLPVRLSCGAITSARRAPIPAVLSFWASAYREASHEAARVHSLWCGGGVAARGSGAAVGDAGHRVSQRQVGGLRCGDARRLAPGSP